MAGLGPACARHVLRLVGYGLVGALLVLITGYVIYLDSRPDLAPWHYMELESEFHADQSLPDFEAYLALEERLFRELEQRIYGARQSGRRAALNRYRRGSLSDPHRWPVNWNRSFELKHAAPRAGVLLLHGMSDSPYSLRALGQRLHATGAWVVAPRLPGHGTAPSGLVEVTWQDMLAVTRLARRHLRERIGDRPLYIVGYSTGGALAVEHVLERLNDGAEMDIAGLVLISPAIGVSRLAVLAVWQARLGHLLGLEKVAWNSILPEYDPFKYNSFALNAGDQVYRLTVAVQSALDRAPPGSLQRLPPILAFQSVVDATVSSPALLRGLFARLPAAGHEVVLFDINRRKELADWLAQDPGPVLQDLLTGPQLPFSLSVLTNRNRRSPEVVVRHRAAGSEAVEETDSGMAWPEGIHSVSHVALPFPPDDPLYGGPNAPPSPGLNIGNAALRGERGVLQVPAEDMLRQRWNPFFSYLEARVLAFTALAPSQGAADRRREGR